MRPGEQSSSALLLAASAAWPRVALPMGGSVSDTGAPCGGGVGSMLQPLLSVAVAPLAVLLAVKQSHLCFPVHWHKHIADFHQLQDLVNAHQAAAAGPAGAAAGADHGSGALDNFAAWARVLVTLRRSEAEARYGGSKVASLDIPNEAFFKVRSLRREAFTLTDA